MKNFWVGAGGDGNLIHRVGINGVALGLYSDTETLRLIFLSFFFISLLYLLSSISLYRVLYLCVVLFFPFPFISNKEFKVNALATHEGPATHVTCSSSLPGDNPAGTTSVVLHEPLFAHAASFCYSEPTV